MIVSVITVCKDSGKTIDDTIKSVKSQTHKEIEHIFCDGGSQDNTVDIIQSHYGEDSILLNGPDKGIYDAINKGIKHCTGEIVAILNSDDFYASDQVIENVVNAFENGTEAAYGDLVYIKPENTSKIVRYWKTGTIDQKKFQRGWTIPHPALFIRKSVYDKYGLYNDSYKIAGDYDLILRLFYTHKISSNYIPKILVKMRTGGASNGSLPKKLAVHREDVLAWKNNGLKGNSLILWLKPLRKLGQYMFHKIK
ncbi:MAG: glycosyltransferase [Cyclobacteriaceae bacterium]